MPGNMQPAFLWNRSRLWDSRGCQLSPSMFPTEFLMPSWAQSHLKRRLHIPDFLLRYVWFFCGVKGSFCLFLAGCNMHVLIGAGASICDSEVEATRKMTNQETSDDVGTTCGPTCQPRSRILKILFTWDKKKSHSIFPPVALGFLYLL